MTENRKLYPFRFLPITFDRSWGRETWTVADLGFADSEIEGGWLGGNTISDLMETYLERVVGENVYQYYGRQFPVMVRFLEIDSDMPLTVNPGDAVAMERYDSLGMAKLWYVLDASPDARLRIGFRRDVTASEFYTGCMDGTVDDLLQEIVPRKGGHYMIAPGTVHSATGRLKLVCICESSDANFTLCDPGLPQEDKEIQMLQIGEALDFIDFGKAGDSSAVADEGPIATILVERPEFNVTKINLSAPLHIYTEKFESYIIYICVDGEASIQYSSPTESGGNLTQDIVLRRNEAVMIPAELPDFLLVPRSTSTVLLEAVTRPAEDVDGYIDPDTEPFLEGEDYGGVEDETDGLEDDSEEPDEPIYS
ncbi:MAG: hypothetical protein ACI3ZL_01405 [Candidatus Cryptobacteroides sp.]